jgi:hypothetical protein
MAMDGSLGSSAAGYVSKSVASEDYGESVRDVLQQLRRSGLVATSLVRHICLPHTVFSSELHSPSLYGIVGSLSYSSSVTRQRKSCHVDRRGAVQHVV